MKYAILLILLLNIFVVSACAAPVSEFTSNVTFGSFPLAVSFTDLSANSPTGWAWYFGDEDMSGSWTEMNSSAGWSGRSYHSSVALPDGSIVLMGGYAASNDVWRSVDNGSTWTEMNSSAGWSARYAHSSVALPDGSIVLMGGIDASFNYKNDVWRSTDNGATWTEMNSSADWSARESFRSVALPDGSIVLMGGYDGSSKNDVWRSVDNGSTWTEMNSSAGWSARYAHSSVALPDGSIVLMGGIDASFNYKNDVWRSTDNGATWTEMNSSADWSARHSHTSVALPDGSIVLMGGLDGSLKNDVWHSTDNGATWTEMNSSADWSARHCLSSVALPDGNIIIMGGLFKNDVWRINTAGSNGQNPTHTYTQEGTYKVTLNAFNAAGSNANTKASYITAPVAPVANFTADVTSGTAPLSVSFNDTSTNSPTSWLWDFGDGATSTVQNATHTYTTAGTYNVSLTATNVGGNNTSMQIERITVNPGSSESSSPSSSGTRVSVSQGQDPEIVTATVSSIMHVTGGSGVNYEFSDRDTPVVSISFDAKNDEGLVVSKVQVLSESPKGIPSPSGTYYQLMSIDVGNEGTISTENADNVLIRFKVSREWIEDNDIDVSTIRMTMYHGEQWQDLPTTQVIDDGEIIYFIAETPGFSIFSIVGDEMAETDNEDEPVVTEETVEIETEELVAEQTPGFGSFSATGVLLSAFVFYRRKD